MSNDIQKVDTAKRIIASMGDDFAKVCTDQTINFEREAKFAVQLLQNNSFLLETAYSNPDSLRNAITNVAAIGISLNPAKKQAYLVPRKNNSGVRGVCLDISYMGLLHLAQITGAIFWGKADVVRANDEFELTSLGSQPMHKFKPFAKPEQRGDVVGAYVVVKTTDNDYLTHTMEISDIYKIRNRSEAWKNGQKGPWATDENEMIKKTVVKQASKYWPHRDRLQEAIHHLDTEGGEGIEKDVTPHSVIPETKNDDDTKLLVARLEAVAEKGLDQLKQAWQALTKEERAAVGLDRLNEMKAKAPIEGESVKVDSHE